MHHLRCMCGIKIYHEIISESLPLEHTNSKIRTTQFKLCNLHCLFHRPILHTNPHPSSHHLSRMIQISESICSQDRDPENETKKKKTECSKWMMEPHKNLIFGVILAAHRSTITPPSKWLVYLYIYIIYKCTCKYNRVYELKG